VVGTGSTFWFTVRLGYDGSAEAAPLPRSVRGLRVLVLTDGSPGRALLCRQLESWGVAVTAASCPSEAVAVLVRAARRHLPLDLVVLDLPSTEETRAAVRMLRGRPELRDLRLLAIGSVGQPSDDALNGVVDARLMRPVRASQLHDCLIGLVAGERPEDVAASSPIRAVPPDAPRARDDVRILVAEDNVVNQKVAGRMLEKLGYRADMVANGREAVDALRRISYALVLMDCQMPEMDGFEATAIIRGAECDDRRTPIVAMTASAMQGDREQCLAAGMDDYVAKPVRPSDLASVLERWVGERHDAP
jgi:CheY-like chemotaxis protein